MATNKRLKILILFPLVIVTAAIVILLLFTFFSKDHPLPFVGPVILPTSSPTYVADIQPIFNRRCIACHGCLGSPCNVKLDSFRGVERGGFGLNPYSLHFESYPRTDIDVVETTEQWRHRGFYPILSRGGSAETHLAQSLLYRMVQAGYRHNQPGFSRETLMPLYHKRYDNQCPSTAETLDAYLTANPAAGMPFGLPAVSAAEFEALKTWVANGSPGPTEQELRTAETVNNPTAVEQWEDFFNSPDKRSRLVARYIFEHVFLAGIVLEESPGDFFRLVRSKTPPTRTIKDQNGKEKTVSLPVEIIDTPLPYDNPYLYAGIDKFYYRLQKITTPIIQKNHFVWRLKLDDIEHLRTLFLSQDWDSAADLDPPWGIGNPFLIFRAIPATARYRFLLENAELIVSGITYGPVCLGQTATYAVKDHFWAGLTQNVCFWRTLTTICCGLAIPPHENLVVVRKSCWVYFIDPKYDVSVQDPELELSTWNVFMNRSLFGNADYEAAYAKALARLTPKGYTLEAIWNGDGHNSNAWLTVLRHETNVSVLRGRQGGIPPTQWLMGYSGFERIYYDTVASFKYWEGDLAKLQTLIFFNDLRQEFEDNFLLLLPRDERAPIRDRWSQGFGAVGLLLVPFAGVDQPIQIETGRRHPLLDLVDKIQTYLGRDISGPVDELNPWIKPDVSLNEPIKSYDDWVKALSTLTVTTRYQFPRYLPSVILLKLDHGTESRVYSLIANRVYKTQFTLLFQNGEALPEEDTMSVYPIIIGGFPNLFNVSSG